MSKGINNLQYKVLRQIRLFYLYRVYCLTPSTSLVQLQYTEQNLHRLAVEQIPKLSPHPRSKINVLATHQTL